MLIPSIDLMGGKIVQLVQGRKKALEFDDFEEWVKRFSKYPLVQLIDLDAAIGTGNNIALAKEFARKLPCQLGGGIRSVEAAQAALAAGAQRVIIGSALFAGDKLDHSFAEKIAAGVGCQPSCIRARCDRWSSCHPRMAKADRGQPGGDNSRAGAVVCRVSLYEC